MPLVPDRPIPAAVAVDRDALQALDEEIARLPQHLRTAVLLCELDGLPRKAAAARLAIPEGTLSSRLGKARKLLACAGRVAAASPCRRVRCRCCSTVPGPRPAWAALADAATRLAGPGPVSETVATLSREVYRIMLLNRLKHLALLVALTTIVASGTLRQAQTSPGLTTRPNLRPLAEVPKPGGARTHPVRLRRQTVLDGPRR